MTDILLDISKNQDLGRGVDGDPRKTLPKVDFNSFNVWQDLRTLPAIHLCPVVWMADAI